jgi:regulator of replication initiation timing
MYLRLVLKVISRKEAREKGLKSYFTGLKCCNGHISTRNTKNGSCLDCKRQHKKDNLELYIASFKKHQDKNKDKIQERSYAWKDKNPDIIRESKRNWRRRNPFQGFVRDTLSRVERLSGKKKVGFKGVELILGYDQKEFKDHIESLWQDGMHWGNRSEWHIDHIKPVSLFIKEGVTDISKINALSNLQPLWAADNLRKGKSYPSQ